MKVSDFPDAFNGEFRPALTKCRCPKCGSRTIQISESIEAFTSFQVVDGRLNREGGIHDFGGWIGRLTGWCNKCDHRWKMKKSSQIEDVVTELDPDTFRPLYEDGTNAKPEQTEHVDTDVLEKSGSLDTYQEGEAGEHQVVLDAIEAHNTGEVE